MDKWKNITFSKEEEEGVVVADDEVCEEESFQRTLAGKLWLEGSFNARAFKATMISAWKLRNPVDIQDLSKNLFLFKFSSRRDLEFVLKNGPWSFDRALLVLNRVSGEEQPSDLDMHFGVFWVRIYDLPLMLRSEAMARKLGSLVGKFEELDMRDACRNGRFMRLKVTIDLKLPLKRGTMVKFKEKNVRVHFKYERLPTFCFVCGRISHQLKDCESLEDLTEEGFEELEEQDLSFGQWLRASPLPKMLEEVKKKDSSSGTCSKSLFNASSSHSKCEPKDKEVEDENEVQQSKQKVLSKEINPKLSDDISKSADVETVAESLGEVVLSSATPEAGNIARGGVMPKRKWVRKKGERRNKVSSKKTLEHENSKRQLVDVMIVDGSVEDCGSGEKKRRQVAESDPNLTPLPEVVLEAQHRLSQ
ncbi:uncharacterized protein LOC131598649 [Vicia villosa]|uniref:uncharacterized protein LOC131598649 n=1 Tax=Vicia villosa TaxID=3911 RepID=UPI00273A9018|nr:uncharacterized protein LOC131598649 [Vicia villosa]